MSVETSNKTQLDILDDELLARYGIIVGAFTLAYCLPGAICIFVVLASLVKCQAANVKPFSILVINLLGVDSTIVMLFLVFAAPCDIFITSMSDERLKIWAATYQAVAFTISLFTSFVISANRFVAIFFPHKLGKIFAAKNTYVYTCCLWVIGTLWTMSDIWTTGCYYIFGDRNFIFNRLCPVEVSDSFSLAYLASWPLYAIGGLYLISLIKLKYDQSAISTEVVVSGMAKRSLRVFYQAFGIWACILANFMAYHIIAPHVTSILTNGLVTVVLILCPAYGSSVIIFIFDKKLRKTVISICKFNTMTITSSVG